MTKARFWQPLVDLYPEEMTEFTNWVDEYKRRTEWDNIFVNMHRASHQRIKYHDLPNAMQIGIFIQYTVEHGGEYFFQNGNESTSMENMIHAITRWFHNEHSANQLPPYVR